MPQHIKKAANALVAEALDGLPAITVEEAIPLVGAGTHVFVDVRESTEQAKGVISGAVLSSRGLLEFHIDPNSPIHKEDFARETNFIFYCASGARSALAAKVAINMGLGPILNLTGGFLAWRNADGPTDDQD